MMVPDPVTDTRLKSVLPDLAIRWRKVRQNMWDAHELQMRVTDGYRSVSDQWKYWYLGRIKDKDGTWIIGDASQVVTHAKPLESLHNYGLALDSCFMGDDPYLAKDTKAEFLWSEYGRFCKANSLDWGGIWKGMKNDRPHCELSYGLNIHSLQILFEDGGIKGVWNKCKILSTCGAELVHDDIT